MKTIGIITAILAALFMGTIGVFSRKTVLDAEVITFFRLLFGAGFLALLMVPTRRLKLLKRWPTWPVLFSGLVLSGFIIFYIKAMSLTTMANAIMVLYLAPPAAAIFAHFFLGEKLTGVSTLLICTALLGFAMMMEFKVDLSTSPNHLPGLGFAFLGLACYTAFILVNRTIRSDIHIYPRALYQLLTGALCLVPLVVMNFPEISPVNWLWLLGAGFFPGFLGILFAVIALEKLTAATFGTLAYFEPIFVIALGWALFNETLNTVQCAGCLVILLSGAMQGYLATGARPESVLTGRPSENSLPMTDG